MAARGESSYADLVYDVLRSAGQPLTFREIFDRVNQRRPVTTKNPTGTIRGALSQGSQLISLGDGRYGYLPHLLQGSLLRLLLTEKKPAQHPLIYTEELRHALWPDFFESQKRKVRRPVQVRLRDGGEVVLSLEFFGAGTWGCLMPDGLRRYLSEQRARAGDSLLLRVVDGEAGSVEAWFESGQKQDKASIARRNQELADAVEQLLRRNRSAEMFIWDLVVDLLARGFYRSDVAPDPLESVLSADPRFVDAGLNMWVLAEAVTPEMQALIDDRRRAETEVFHLGAGTPTRPEPAASPLHMRYAMERTLADVRAAVAGREFASLDEMNVFLQQMLAGGGLPGRVAGTPLEQAQDLMYDAWESPSSQQRVRLAKRALELSPDCADAYVLLAEETAGNARQAADLYARGVAAGERALGKGAFKEDVGHFWGIVETRPYMRARLGLAHALWAMGQRQEAIEHLWDMLRLNPSDNQGVRYVLLDWLLELGHDAQVKELLDRFPDDAAAIWLYGRALHAFRTRGDTARSRKPRDEAKAMNPHVPAYLLGRKRLPRRLPELVGFGDESEATVCAAEQMQAWRTTPGALAWLQTRSDHGPARPDA